MLGWIIKMLLKVMKPFAKMAILEMIMGYVADAAAEDATSEPAPEETTAAD